MKVARIVKYGDKEYKFLIGDEPTEYCDLCVFREDCAKVVSREITVDQSPMKLCIDLTDEFNTHFACFTD